MGSPGTSLDQSAWNPPEYAPNSSGNGMRGNGFGGSMMGMSGSGYRPGGRFGRSGLGMHSDNDESPYSALGGFLQPTAAEFLPQQEPELPLESSLESIIGGGADVGPDDDLEKKQRLDFALPSSPSRFQHHYSSR